MQSSGSSQLVEIGKVGRPHGYQGAFVVQASSGTESALSYLSEIRIGKTPNEVTKYNLTETSWMPKGWKVVVRELTSDTDAKALNGLSVYALREQLQNPDEGEFYLHDLKGCAVWDEASEKAIGTFEGVEPRDGFGGIHDRWWIQVEGQKISIPATKDFVARVDLREKKIWIRNWKTLTEETE